MKDDNVMIGRKNFFRSPIKNDLITYDNIRKIGTGQGEDQQLAVCWTIIISKYVIR